MVSLALAMGLLGLILGLFCVPLSVYAVILVKSAPKPTWTAGSDAPTSPLGVTELSRTGIEESPSLYDLDLPSQEEIDDEDFSGI